MFLQKYKVFNPLCLPLPHPLIPFPLSPVNGPLRQNSFTLYNKTIRMTSAALLSEKINEITDELKRLNLWKKQQPEWVMSYEKKIIGSEQDFSDWLQFVYLPNCYQQAVHAPKVFIVPQAMRFFGEDVKKGRLMQLLIELDALL
jgi:uncharacterized protein YqcC (DUF446 family)